MPTALLHSSLVGIVLTIFALPLFAQSEDWDVETELPPVTHVGDVTEEEKQIGIEMRERMIEVLSYWKDRGLANPPDLEGLYHLTSFEHMKVTEVLGILNPGIEDIRAHVLEQHRILERSELGFALKKIDSALKSDDEDEDKDQDKGKKKLRKHVKKIGKKKLEQLAATIRQMSSLKDEGEEKKKRTSLFQTVFDYYGMVRYGFTVDNLIDAVRNDKTIDETGNHKQVLAPHSDNAYFGRFPKFDLKDVLIEAKDQDPERKIDLQALLNETKLSEVSDHPEFFSRRIVLLPRTSESIGDTEVSTLLDQSVADHEMGHNLNHFLASRHHKLHRMVDEVMADYIAASPRNHPLIGEHFAEASGIISERLKGSKEYAELVGPFARIGAKGFLRDMSRHQDIDMIDRHYTLSNDYDGGQPARWFLWQLRTSTEVDHEKLDSVALRVLPEFASLPALISPRSQAVIYFRSLKRYLAKNYLIYVATKELTQQATSQDEELTERKKKEIEIAAKDRVSKQLSELETNRQGLQRGWQIYGWGRRPAVTADYVLPEFFRSFYRIAQKDYPELAPHVRKTAEKAMNSSSILIKTPEATEMVFVRTPANKLDLAARLELKRALSKMSKLRRPLIELAETSKRDEAQDKELKSLRAKYVKLLDKVQEYERTGSTFRLFVPHPVISALLLSAKLGYYTVLKPAGWALKGLGVLKSKEDKESAEEKEEKETPGSSCGNNFM